MKRAKVVAKTKCVMYIACGVKHLVGQAPDVCPLGKPGVPCNDGYTFIYGKGVKSHAKEETFGRAAVRSQRKARSVGA